MPWSRLAIGVAVLLAGLVYVNALDNPFVYDDRRLIVENRSIRPPLNLQAVVLREVMRPAVNISYAIDRVLWGPSPAGFHVTNVLLHMLNVALLFEFVRRGTGRVVSAFIAAALFAVHPMMTQAVGYISGRAEVLCTTFVLMALAAARRWMLGGRGVLAGRDVRSLGAGARVERDRRRLCGAGVCLRPARADRHAGRAETPARLAPRTAYRPRRRWRWPDVSRCFTMLEHPGQVQIDWSLGLLELDVLRRYVTMLILPGGQTIFHELAPVTGWLDPRVLMALGDARPAGRHCVADAARRRHRHARHLLVSPGIRPACGAGHSGPRRADGRTACVSCELRVVHGLRRRRRPPGASAEVERAAARADHVSGGRRPGPGDVLHAHPAPQRGLGRTR